MQSWAGGTHLFSLHNFVINLPRYAADVLDTPDTYIADYLAKTSAEDR